MRDLILDFKRGGASVPEVVHGIVRIWGTEVRPNGPSVVVTTETTLKLSDGKATLANAQTSGTGPLYEWAYIIQVEPFCGRNYRFYVAIPDGTGPVNLVDLPKLNPITGEGFYVDIEEWEALYGALPSRVDALEEKNTAQDTALTQGLASAATDATTKANAAKTDAIMDAATKYGGLSAKVVELEANAFRRITPLGTMLLDDVKTAGYYPQSSSGNATLARGYPVGTGGRGLLRVTLVSASIVFQEYFATFLGRYFIREYTGTAWSAWGEIGAGGEAAPITGAFLDKGPIGAGSLDDVRDAGIYRQASTSSATEALKYPAGSRGTLTVKAVTSLIVGQTYHATWTGQVFVREYSGTAWSEWVEIGAGSGGADPRVNAVIADVTVLNAEQDTQDARLGTLEAQTGLANPVTGAQVDSGGLLTFSLADGGTTGGVTIPASLPVDQVDYVEQLRRRTTTTTLELRKSDSMGGIEVSCVSPSGKHTTYAFRQAGTGTIYDDYHIQSMIWVGDSTGSTRNKTTAVGPTSNRDFAIQIAPAGSSAEPKWVPYHTDKTAFAAEPAAYYNGDQLLDMASLTVGQVLQLDSFELVQHVHGRHPDNLESNLIEVWTTHRISKDGVLSIDGKWRALQDVALGSNYVMMCPVNGTLFDTVVSSLNNSYPNHAGMYGTSTSLVSESDVAVSYAFLSSANRGVAVGFRYNNIAETLRRGLPDKDPIGSRAFLEHRNASFLKLYNKPWLKGAIVPAGTVHRFSGDYLYAAVRGVYDQYSR